VTASLIEHQRPERARPLVVIVDQDRMSAMILARALERGGYLVECVASAVAGLDLLGQRDAVAVICEAVLQDLPASAFIVRARQLYAPRSLPVFVVTADARPAQRLALLRAGIVDCLNKPVEAEELRLRIERALGTTVEPLATPVHLSGDLVHFPLPDVLAMLELAHYTGQIDVAGARCSGAIELANGRPRHASYGRHVGAAAFRAILRQARGWFRVHPGQSSTANTLCGSTTQLVLEASVAEANRRRTPSLHGDRLEELGVTTAMLRRDAGSDPEIARLAGRLAIQLADPHRIGELVLADLAAGDPAPHLPRMLTVSLFGDLPEMVNLLGEVAAPIQPQLLVRAARPRTAVRWMFQGRNEDRLYLRIIDLADRSAAWFDLASDAVVLAAPAAGPRVVDPALRAYVIANRLPAVIASRAADAAQIFAPAPFNAIRVLDADPHDLGARALLAAAVDAVAHP